LLEILINRDLFGSLIEVEQMYSLSSKNGLIIASLLMDILEDIRFKNTKIRNFSG